jgi:hypothetical protein
MNHLMTHLLLCLSIALLPGVLCAQDDKGTAPADRPELKMLAHLQGEWTGTIDNGESESNLKLSHRWILGGHVLQTTIRLNEYESHILRTYDNANQQYLVTYMDASGTALVMTGRWDKDQKELVASGKQGDKAVNLSTKFVDDNTTRWTIRDGENVITGVNRRDSR